MCMADDAERYNPFHSYEGRAVRDYHCDECGRIIAAGERYERASGVLGGYDSWDVWRTCWHCVWAREWLTAQCGGWCFTGVYEDLTEHWHEEHLMRSRDLAVRIVGMRRKWRRRDGSLMNLSRLTNAAK
jgi:hypothetical protein